MNPFEILEEFYEPGTKLHGILVTHGHRVAEKALAGAKKVAHLNPDLQFIREAAMLHDIAVFMTALPKLGCYGMHPYVCHGILGRNLLEEKGLFLHALVCERHVGVGFTVEDILKQGLPLPLREMCPISIEEKLITYADKFFSKTADTDAPNSVEKICAKLERFGPEKVAIFREWMELFE
jgi:uncharacterized protein